MSGFKSQAIWLFGSTCFSAVLQVAQLSFLARKLETHELGLLAIINAIGGGGCAAGYGDEQLSGASPEHYPS